jgi:hypothetical protein
MKITDKKYIQNFYYLEMKNKGIENYKLFGNKKGLLTYLHEELQKTYIDYDTKMLGNYQSFNRKLKNIGTENYTNIVKDTFIKVKKLEALKNYKGAENNEIYELINK